MHGAACGPRGRRDERHQHHSHSRGGGGWGRGPFGVRRPLRFMARELDLDDDQVEELAGILDDLKTQRAQARVDRRKAVSVFADAFLADAFDGDRVRAACKARAESEGEVEGAVAMALERTFKLLDKEQRKRLAYLLRSDGLNI
jgi:Spy/CpxP family protein refolding chaperone